MTMTDKIAKKESAYLTEKTDSLTEILEQNMGGEDLSRFDFPRIKVPAGGAQHLVMPDGEPQKTVRGIIMLSHMSRAYWPGGDDPDTLVGGPPQCSSEDGVTGNGVPGGDCHTCPLSKPGSGKGQRQACKLMRNLYLLMPGQILPTVVQCPPGSLKAVRSYLVILSSLGRASWTFETEIGAKQVTNKAGQKYSELTFKKVRELEGDELASAIQYAAAFKATTGIGRSVEE
jgi:hypothetical protein